MKHLNIKHILACLLIFISSDNQAQAAVLFQEDFEGATDGDTWVGYNGWSKFGLGGANHVAEIFDYGVNSQMGDLGFYTPSTGTSLEAVAHTIPSTTYTSIGFTVDFGYFTSDTGSDDNFNINFHNSSGNILGGFSLITATNTLHLHDDAVSTGSTSVSEATLYTLSGVVDLAANTWTVSIDGTEMFTDVQFNGTGESPLDIGIFSLQWIINDVANPGDNYISVDNISVWEIPEPSTAILFALGILGFSVRRIRV